MMRHLETTNILFKQWYKIVYSSASKICTYIHRNTGVHTENKEIITNFKYVKQVQPVYQKELQNHRMRGYFAVPDIYDDLYLVGWKTCQSCKVASNVLSIVDSTHNHIIYMDKNNHAFQIFVPRPEGG